MTERCCLDPTIADLLALLNASVEPVALDRVQPIVTDPRRESPVENRIATHVASVMEKYSPQG